MATYNTDLAEQQMNGKFGSLPNGALAAPNKGFVPCVYTMRGDETTSDSVRIMKIKAGQLVNPCESHVYADGVGTSINIDIGDTADSDGYLDGQNIHAGGRSNWASSGINIAYAISPKAYTEEDWLVCDFNTVSSPTAGGTITFWVSVSGI